MEDIPLEIFFVQKCQKASQIPNFIVTRRNECEMLVFFHFEICDRAKCQKNGNDTLPSLGNLGWNKMSKDLIHFS